MFRFTTFTIFALAATFVAAQSTTTSPSTPDPSGSNDTCISDCFLLAYVSSGCSTSTDIYCICTNQDYQTVSATCLQTSCPDQLATATVLHGQSCSGLTPPIVTGGVPSGTPSASGTPGTSAPGTPAPSSSRPSTSAPASSGTGTPTSNTASSSRSTASTTGAAVKNAPVAGAMGALAALVGAAIF